MIKPHVRALIAAAAISHASGRELNSIYQYGENSGHKSISMSAKSGKIAGYEYGSSSHFEVTVKSNNASFYDYGGSGWTEFSA